MFHQLTTKDCHQKNWTANVLVLFCSNETALSLFLMMQFLNQEHWSYRHRYRVTIPIYPASASGIRCCLAGRPAVVVQNKMWCRNLPVPAWSKCSSTSSHYSGMYTFLPVFAEGTTACSCFPMIRIIYSVNYCIQVSSFPGRNLKNWITMPVMQ